MVVLIVGVGNVVMMYGGREVGMARTLHIKACSPRNFWCSEVHSEQSDSMFNYNNVDTKTVQKSEKK